MLDEAGTTGTALAVRDGKVLAVGGDDLRDRYAAEREVDLAGRAAMPGFNDAHIHIRGRARRHIRLGGIASIEELQDLVAAKADELGPGEWITGYGWSEDEVREQRRAAPGRPRRRRSGEPGHPDAGGGPQRGGVESRAVARGAWTGAPRSRTAGSSSADRTAS